MTYEQCYREIEELSNRGIHRGLERVQEACKILGEPQNKFPSIHIAGTNGKGSTAAMCAEILKQAGYKTGFTLSPHVLDFRERIQINGEWIPKEEVIHLHSFLKKKVGPIPLTYFEWVTLMAFVFFAEHRVDMVVLETGMGGRWDATNVARPLIGAITNVDLDHQQFLGNTVEEILAEKMQILKPGMVAWTGISSRGVFNTPLREYCSSKKIPLHFLDEHLQSFPCGLKGEHQKRNAGLAVGIMRSLIEKGFRISEEAIRAGLMSVKWPGRLEVVSDKPLILLDGAHNPAGIQTLVGHLSKNQQRYHLVFGTLKDRPFEEMAASLKPFVQTVHWASFDGGERSYSKEELKKSFDGEVIEMNLENWQKFLEGIPCDEAVLVCGSLYLVSQVRSYLKGHL